MLMHGPSLYRYAIPNGGDRLLQSRGAVHDEELRSSQATLDQVIEHRSPGLGPLATHGLDREQDLLAIGAHADDDEQRDRGRLAVEPHAYHGAVVNEPHVRCF